MAKFEYIPQGVCSRKMSFDIENDIIKDIKIDGGCSGNSQGVAALCRGKSIDEVISILSGIKCGARPTSCPDQLAKALSEYKVRV